MSKSLINSLVGKIIKVDRGSSNCMVGKVLAVYNGYIVLLTQEECVLYYQLHHLKSVSGHSKNYPSFSLEVPKNLKYKYADNFLRLLEELRFQWVSINVGDTENIEGIIGEVDSDYVTLIIKEEFVRIPVYHIKSIILRLKTEA